MISTMTLSEYILSKDQGFQHGKSDLLNLFTSIELASKVIHREVNRAGLGGDILGAVGSQNIQGEDQQKLDVYANDQFIHALASHGLICGIASEEDDSFLGKEAGLNPEGKYILTMDPLDGSSNIDVNVSIGTIFSIYERISAPGSDVHEADFLQEGKKQLVGGYVLYGTSTQFVFTTGDGVHAFTLDPQLGSFCLAQANIKSKDDGKIYSINEGNYPYFSKGLQNYISYCKSDDGKSVFTARYIGSLVADFHRNLLKGGIYIYPGTTKAPKGKLRLLYEANPLAFITEQAGGIAHDGSELIMNLKPQELHQRVPLIIGSKNMVNKALEYLKD